MKPPLQVVAAVVLLSLCSAVRAQGGDAPLRPSTRIGQPPRGAAERTLPIILRADRVSTQLDQRSTAEGDVDFRQGGLTVGADRVTYDWEQDFADALGRVRIERDGNTYRGSALQLQVQRFEGVFLDPTFDFPAFGSGGRAERIEFLGRGRARAFDAWYTSCSRDDLAVPGAPEPDWVLRAQRVTLDFDNNEGLAEGAVLRFLRVPILATPRLSFPLNDARKSGWLPPSLNIDNRSGIELGAPYYWNIAPNRDATIAPRMSTRRGLALEGQLRYLEPGFAGTLDADWLPDDREQQRSRQAIQWLHDGTVGSSSAHYGFELTRVSDDDWWKDFPGRTRSFTPRLLALRAGIEQPFDVPLGSAEAYARTLQWQVLQGSDSRIDGPYERSPQIGVAIRGGAGGFVWAAESEFNRFTLPHGEAQRDARAEGERLHLLASLSRPWRGGGWWLTPSVAVNAAAYDTAWPAGEARPRSASRAVPTFSLDSGLEFERSTRAFGRDLRQTLEPRLRFVNTPYREQSQLPNFDSAGKDFTFTSIFWDNAFSGVDRVSDARQLTAGVTTRLLDDRTGVEALRLGFVQRYLFEPQRVAPRPDGTVDGPPLEQRVSDALLLGSATVFPGWTLDGAVQYSPDSKRAVRSLAGARWSPGPFRTVGATYRQARGLSEQLEVGWQWPVYGRARGDGAIASRAAGNGCSGALYSVGRFNYSLKDSRFTDSILGLEYDAGCWIARVVSERLSTGRSEATTRLLLQLELVGLSRLGSNPLVVLKDNIPGYRLLRDERRGLPLMNDDRAEPSSPSP